jgi:hypothetical protein
MSRLEIPLAPMLDAHCFAASSWWSDSLLREQVDALRRKAMSGHLRPFQIMTCTAGGPHLREVTRSFVEMIEQAGLGVLQCAGRPLLRWLMIQRANSPSIDEMAATLASSGVEVILRTAPQHAAHSIFDGRRALLDAALNHDLSDVPIVLFLDDDLAFDALYSGPDGIELGAPWPWLPALWLFHEARPEIEVAIGGVTGAPPLPASSTLATNLFDLDAAIHGHTTFISPERWSEPDYYYDLSLVRTVNSPYPMIAPMPEGEDLIDALMIHGTLARPLVATPTTITTSRSGQVVRGGNTVLFNLDWLKCPHPQARLGPLRLRRADTIWAQAAVNIYGCRMEQLPWPLRHIRDARGWTAQTAQLWRERLLADLAGVGLYRGIDRWRSQMEWRRVGELNLAAADVIACTESRRQKVSDVLRIAQRRCMALHKQRPELVTVSAAIEDGLTAVTALDLGPQAIHVLLAELSSSMEVCA